MSKTGAALLVPGSLQQIQAVLVERLSQLSETPELEAQVLLAHVLGQPRAWILAHPEVQLDSQLSSLTALVERRISGEPLPYILGRWEFFGLQFLVTPAVLIPRPETELLVEYALAWIKDKNRVENKGPYVVDVGTGTGCIAITLAAYLPGRRLIAVDISRSALEVALSNVAYHHVESQVWLVQGDLLEAFAGHCFDLICANLPYIPSQALKELPIFGREPALAMDGGPDGLRHIRNLLSHARYTMAPGGLMLLEIESGQGAAAQSLAAKVFPQAAIGLYKDLAGLDRLIAVQT